MKRIFFILCLLLLVQPISVAFAGVGDTDNRYYVTGQDWAKEPYKRFVSLSIELRDDDHNLEEAYSCTAQYISRNLILSAGHCTKKSKAFEYWARDYNDNLIPLKLLETPYAGSVRKLGDWAVFLVTDPKYYSDFYFDIQEPTRTVDVMNAGFGWARIIKDSEIPIIRNILNDLIKEKESSGKTGLTISDLEKELNFRIGLKGLKPLTESYPEKLKASKCRIVFEDCEKLYSSDRAKFQEICNNQKYLTRGSAWPDIVATTCDGWGGNSGGGYISLDGKNSLYGTCSFGADSFEDMDNTDYIASAKQFKTRISELIKENLPIAIVGKKPADVVSGNISTKPIAVSGEEITITGGNPADMIFNGISTDVSQSDIAGQAINAVSSVVQNASGGADIQEDIDDLTQEVTNLSNTVVNAPQTNADVLSIVNTYVTYEVKSKLLEKLKAYQEAKEKEQSKANRMLTAATIAATGIGGMELAQGLAEQKADKAAEQAMDAYIATMRCKYGNGKQVKAGLNEIELPGGNDETMMKLRSEYFMLAVDLKERKQALGIKPGIESEEILDKSEMGLYDQENIGITNGAYSSLYRAKMLNSEKDQTQIDEAKETSKKRVVGGGTAAGAGVVGGVVGDRLINGKSRKKN